MKYKTNQGSILLFQFREQEFKSNDIGKSLFKHLIEVLVNKGFGYLPDKADPYEPDWVIPIQLSKQIAYIYLVVYRNSPAICSIHLESSEGKELDKENLEGIRNTVHGAIADLKTTSELRWFEFNDKSWLNMIPKVFVDPEKRSPRVIHAEWGKIVLEDKKTFKDVKCYPGGSSEWNWNQTGTRHSPGIQIADIEELLQNGAQIIVLSTGYHKLLHITEGTKEYLQEKKIPYYIFPTEEAIKIYNSFCDTNNMIGALLHSTC